MFLYIYINKFWLDNQFNFKGWNHEKISLLKTCKRKKNNNKKWGSNLIGKKKPYGGWIRKKKLKNDHKQNK